MEKLLSIPDAAKALGGISHWTIRAWLSQGKIPRIKVGGRTMIRESDLAKMAKESPSPRHGK